MRYVFDPSVGICWAVPRPLSAKASRLRVDYQRAVHQLIAPSVFPAETASALTKCERQRIIPVGSARVLFGRVLRNGPILHPFEPLLDRAIDISSGTRAGLYDCLYVALAEQEGCELVTADQRAINSLASHFPFIISLAALP